MPLTNIPKEFLCDLAVDERPMRDPVNYNGTTYERANIIWHLNKSLSSHNAKTEIAKLIPNHRLKARIDKWVHAQITLCDELDARWRAYNRNRLEKLDGAAITTFDRPAADQERFAQFGNNVDSDCLSILVGDPGVGKTMLARRFLDVNDDKKDYFRDENHAHRRIRLNDKNIRINLWDVPGKDSFSDKITYKIPSCHFVILVFDLTDRNTFANLQQHIDYIADFASSITTVVLVGNKCDAENRAVTVEEALHFAETNGIGYVEASAKNDLNVDLIFETARLYMYRKIAALEKDAAIVDQFKSAYKALWEKQWLGSPFNNMWRKVQENSQLTLDEIERHALNSPHTARALQTVKPR